MPATLAEPKVAVQRVLSSLSYVHYFAAASLQELSVAYRLNIPWRHANVYIRKQSQTQPLLILLTSQQGKLELKSHIRNGSRRARARSLCCSTAPLRSSGYTSRLSGQIFESSRIAFAT